MKKKIVTTKGLGILTRLRIAKWCLTGEEFELGPVKRTKIIMVNKDYVYFKLPKITKE